MEKYIEELFWVCRTNKIWINMHVPILPNTNNHCWFWRQWNDGNKLFTHDNVLPFSSEVNPEAASTFSRILLSFITLVAQTYPCLQDRGGKQLVKLPQGPPQALVFASYFIQVSLRMTLLHFYMNLHVYLRNKQSWTNNFLFSLLENNNFLLKHANKRIQTYMRRGLTISVRSSSWVSL